MQQPSHARVVAQHRGAYTLRTPAGEEHAAGLAGALRHAAEFPVVGDHVEAEGDTITRRLPRTGGVIERGGDDAPLAANVDAAWIVTALGRDISPRRVERYLALAAAGRVDPVVVVNKSDLDPDPPLDAALSELRAVAPGVPVLPVSARTGAGIDALRATLAGRTAVLLGSSGVGKSTLTNRLLGAERQATRSTRDGDDKGRHTTTRRELIDLPCGGSLIDTPGLRSVPVTEEAVSAGAFPDVDAIARGCRFADCTHTAEPDCAVRTAVESGELARDRLASYLELAAEADRERVTRTEKDRAGRIGARALRQVYSGRERGRGR